jgi:uncharacterized membrane protein
MAREDTKGSVKDKVEDVVDGGFKSKEVLTSAAVSAVGAIAAAKGPDLIRRVAGATEEKGEDEAEHLGEKAVEGAKKALGGRGSGGKKTRRLPIQRWTDIAVPIDRVYEEWTKFDEFPRFMHRVLNVEKKGRDKTSWQEKIWFSSRQWEGRVTQRRKNDRIVWTTTSGMSHKGIVSFHKLADNLTRVMVTMEFEPNGMVEKMASGLRFVKRAVQADLARFKAYVEMEEAKGIEYRPNPEEDDADEAPTRAQRSDEDRAQQRKEREKGRRERRKTTGSRR